jgi:hypothetical protein
MDSRRQWLCGGAALALSMLAGRRAIGAATAVEPRTVSDFDQIVWRGGGEMTIEQTGRERLSVEAEPAVLAKIVTEVRQGRLMIGFAPGNLVTREPIRVRIELKSLSALETQGSGELRIGPLVTSALALRLGGSQTVRLAMLDARTLDVRLEGSGAVWLDGGRVERQHVVIAGSADYNAAGLASRTARVSIEGSGSARLAVSDQFDVAVAGSGNVSYSGTPQVTQSVSGSGAVRRGSGSSPGEPTKAP